VDSGVCDEDQFQTIPAGLRDNFIARRPHAARSIARFANAARFTLVMPASLQ